MPRADVVKKAATVASWSFTPSVDAPSWQAGDTAIVALSWNNNSALTVPSGWNVRGSTVASTSETCAWVDKVLTSADLTTAQTFSVGSGTRFALVGFADTVVAFDAISEGGAQSGTGPYTLTGPALTTVAAQTRVYAAWAGRWGVAETVTPATLTDIGSAAFASGGIGTAVDVARMAADLTTPQAVGGFGATYADSTSQFVAFTVSYATVAPPAASAWVLGSIAW